MSVILYEDEKFLKLAASMKLEGQKIAHLWMAWGGPDVIEKKIEKFINCLRNANIDACNERYDETHPFKVLDFSKTFFPLTLLQLIKSLKGVSYNCVESEKFQRTKDKLDDVVYYFMGKAIDKLIPEYANVDTW